MVDPQSARAKRTVIWSLLLKYALCIPGISKKNSRDTR